LCAGTSVWAPETLVLSFELAREAALALDLDQPEPCAVAAKLNGAVVLALDTDHFAFLCAGSSA